MDNHGASHGAIHGTRDVHVISRWRWNNLRWFGGRKKKEETEAYYLQYQPEGQRGWVPVEKFANPVSPKDVMDYMTDAGVYNLQKRKGGMIAGYAWDEPYVVKGEVGEEGAEGKVGKLTDSDRIANAIESDMVRAVRWFKLPEMIQQSISKAFGTEGNPLTAAAGGKGETTATSIKDALKAMRAEYDEMDTIFGSKATTDDKKIPVTGSIPAWLVYLPEMIDQTGDRIMSRLEKIGLVGEAKPKQKVFEMPDKPVHTKRLDLSKLKKDAEEKVEESGEKPKAK